MIEISRSQVRSELAPNERFSLSVKSAAFLAMHFALFAPIWCGVSWWAFGGCMFSYFSRMFVVTGILHRYFSHKSWEVAERHAWWVYFAMNYAICVVRQNSGLWWAAHHRHHHRYSDQEEDVHTKFKFKNYFLDQFLNKLAGFYWSHMGWILCSKFRGYDKSKVKDLLALPWMRYFEQGWVYAVCTISYGVLWAGVGFVLDHGFHCNTNWLQMLVWGDFISTVFLYHGTFCINSAAHTWGARPFSDETKDESTNGLITAIITMGEGWHNNHHYYQARVAQAVTPFEFCFDWTYWILRGFECLGIIKLKPDTHLSELREERKRRDSRLLSHGRL